MSNKEDNDLQFISVNHDDDDFRMNQTYTVAQSESTYDSVIGSSIFKASKVLKNIINYILLIT